MTIVFIRHSDKAYRNGKADTYSHDPPLTRGGADRCNKELSNILKYGEPDIVFVSPFLRCRQTAAHLIKSLKSQPELYVDVRVSEYLYHHDSSKISLHEDTESFNPPIDKSYSELEDRVYDFFNSIRNKYKDKVVWVITHGIIMRMVYTKCFDSELKVPYLGHFSV